MFTCFSQQYYLASLLQFVQISFNSFGIFWTASWVYHGAEPDCYSKSKCVHACIDYLVDMMNYC